MKKKNILFFLLATSVGLTAMYPPYRNPKRKRTRPQESWVDKHLLFYPEDESFLNILSQPESNKTGQMHISPNRTQQQEPPLKKIRKEYKQAEVEKRIALLKYKHRRKEFAELFNETLAIEIQAEILSSVPLKQLQDDTFLEQYINLLYRFTPSLRKKILTDKTKKFYLTIRRSLNFARFLKQEDSADNYPWGVSVQELVDAKMSPKITSSYGTFELDLSNLHINDLTGLNEQNFPGLSNIKVLNLSSNPLKAVPSKLFQTFNHISRINLSHTQLESLPEDIFHGLNNLITLQLQNNKLTTLAPKLLQTLNNLYFLNLNNNRLITLPQNLFQNVSNLQVLKLNGNKLTYLPEIIFQQQGNLRNLDIHGNNLTELPSNLFRNLGSLTDLNLRNNKLRRLPETIFQDIVNIEDINLAGNKFAQLPQTIFNGLDQLISINLNNNLLSRLPDLQGLTQLEYIYLESNQFKQLSPSVFHGLNLHELALSNNPLQKECKNKIGNLAYSIPNLYL